MDGRFIQALIDEAFEGEVREEFGVRYLEMLRENWSELVKTLRRTVLLLVALVVAFFLFDHEKTGELTVGPFHTANISALLTLIPAAVSFLLFEAVDLVRASSYYEHVARALIKSLYPSLHEKRLDSPLWPVASFAVGLGFGGLMPRRNKVRSGFLLMMSGMVMLSIVAAVFVFLVYSYFSLYANDGANLIAVSVSLTFVLFNVFRTAFTVVDDLAEESEQKKSVAESGG